MPTYIVTIEDRIYCSGTIRVQADNAAVAALMAKQAAEDGDVTMSPMENGEESPHVYKVCDNRNREIATLGNDSFGTKSNDGCLTDHLDGLLKVEGIEDYEFDENWTALTFGQADSDDTDSVDVIVAFLLKDESVETKVARFKTTEDAGNFITDIFNEFGEYVAVAVAVNEQPVKWHRDKERLVIDGPVDNSAE